MAWPFGDKRKHREAAKLGWARKRERAAIDAARQRSAPRRRAARRRTPQQRDTRMLRGMMRNMHNQPEVQRMIEETPSTGHMDGDTKKMVREVNNWPASWMPERSRARTYLKQEMARDSDETYVYYPMGSHRPVIWHAGKRWTLGEFQERYG